MACELDRFLDQYQQDRSETKKSYFTNDPALYILLFVVSFKKDAATSCSNPGVASAVVRLSREYKSDIYSFIYILLFYLIAGVCRASLHHTTSFVLRTVLCTVSSYFYAPTDTKNNTTMRRL